MGKSVFVFRGVVDIAETDIRKDNAFSYTKTFQNKNKTGL